VSGPGSTTSAGDWSWTPDCADVGTYEVCVTVSDPNQPTVNCVDQVVHYADTLNFFIDGDDDGCPQPLVYTLTAGPGSVNPATGEYTWTPGCGNQGLHFVDVRVWDGQDTALCTFGVTVTNNPPQITCPPNFSSGIGDTVDFVIPASDPDGDSIVFTLLDFQKLSGPTPGGPNFAPSLGVDGHFVWPTTDVNDDDFGVWEVSLRVDEPCDSAFCTFQIDVTPNRPPVCLAPSDKELHWERGSASGQFTFFDPDGDSITFGQISGPGSMDVNGLWTWVGFGCDDRGTYEICAVVADSAFPGGDTCCFMLTILQSAPLLQCHDDSVHAGAGPLQIQMLAPDDGCPGNPVRFHMVSGPGIIDSVTGLYTLVLNTPGFGCTDLGDYDVTVEATDGDLSDTCSFVASVYNNPPTFTCTLPDETLEHPTNKVFVHETNPTDPDGDDLTSLFLRSQVKLSGPPGGPNNPATLNPDGVLIWQTDSSNNADLGIWQFIVEARDTCSISRCTLLVEVLHNRPPECFSGDVAHHIGDTAQNIIIGVDPDKDTLSFTQISGPGSITVTNDVATWTWLTDCADTGTYEICLAVSDDVHPDADTCCFMVTIFQTPPLVSCSTQTVHYDEILTYDIPFDDDACPQAATWSLVSGPGALDAVTGQYTWTTDCADVGTHPVTVALFDGTSADTCTFDVEVTNTPPFVTCPDDLFGLKVGVTVDLDIDFGDTDGDPTTISLVSFQKLGGANANPPNHDPTLDASGHFHWVTDWSNLDDVATWEVSALCSFRIEILPNEAPICTAPPDMDGVCDVLNTATFGASDEEDDPVTFTQISGPGMTDPGSGTWSWLPPCDSGGAYEVCVTVGDFLHPEADTCCFGLSVCAVSEPGDVNGDGDANAEDILLLVNFVFKSGDLPFGAYTADVNCDGLPNSEDIIYLVNYVFKGGPVPCDVCTSPLFPGVGGPLVTSGRP